MRNLKSIFILVLFGMAFGMPMASESHAWNPHATASDFVTNQKHKFVKYGEVFRVARHVDEHLANRMTNEIRGQTTLEVGGKSAHIEKVLPALTQYNAFTGNTQVLVPVVLDYRGTTIDRTLQVEVPKSLWAKWKYARQAVMGKPVRLFDSMTMRAFDYDDGTDFPRNNWRHTVPADLDAVKRYNKGTGPFPF